MGCACAWFCGPAWGRRVGWQRPRPSGLQAACSGLPGPGPAEARKQRACACCGCACCWCSSCSTARPLCGLTCGCPGCGSGTWCCGKCTGIGGCGCSCGCRCTALVMAPSSSRAASVSFTSTFARRCMAADLVSPLACPSSEASTYGTRGKCWGLSRHTSVTRQGRLVMGAPPPRQEPDPPARQPPAAPPLQRRCQPACLGAAAIRPGQRLWHPRARLPAAAAQSGSGDCWAATGAGHGEARPVPPAPWACAAPRCRCRQGLRPRCRRPRAAASHTAIAAAPAYGTRV